MLVREKSEDDLHKSDGYPLYLPGDVPGFITPEYEVAAWVAEREGRIVGHVALHRAAVDPTLAVAQRATALSAERLVVVSRLFTAPDLRRAGVGRALLQRATRHAKAHRQRAVLDVGQTSTAPAALYESEGWERVAALVLRLDEGAVLDLWVYVSPEADDIGASNVG